MRSLIRISTLLLFAFSGQTAFGATAQDPAVLLNSLQTFVKGRTVLIDGALPSLPGVDGWQITVDDAILLSRAMEAGNPIFQVRVLSALREGDNLICIDALHLRNGQASVIVKRWSTHVHTVADLTADRFVILVSDKSDRDVTADVEAFGATLLQNGIPPGKLFRAGDLPDLDRALTTIEKSIGPDDKVLVYFRGGGTIAPTDGEPILQLSSEDTGGAGGGIPLRELLRRTVDLPSLSLLLDVKFRGGEREQGNIGSTSNPNTQYLDPDRRALPWLQLLGKRANVELAMTNPFDTTSAMGLLTERVLSTSRAPAAGCISLSDAIRSMSPARSLADGKPQPIYFAANTSFSSYCILQTSGPTGSLQIDTIPIKFPDSFMIADEFSTTVSAEVPYSWSELLVDGVLMRHSPAGVQTQSPHKIVERVSISEGTHIVELRVGAGKKILAWGKTEVTPILKLQNVSTVSDDLRAEFVRPARSSIYSSSSLATIAFIAADQIGNTVHYEVRNNGVVLFRGIAPNVKKQQIVEIVRRVPLSIGINNLVLEVRHGDLMTLSTTRVVRRSPDPIHAVLVGVDTIPGGVPLHGVQSDVNSMKKLLLRYTDVKAKDIVVLMGREATLAAIRQAIGNASTNRPSDPFLNGEGNVTLFLYFSGYGTLVLNDSKQPLARCILPSDFEIKDPLRTCLSTDEITALLNSWDRSIIVVDASYDGLSGEIHPTPNKNASLFSRTFNSYLSTDSEWRVSSGTDRSDRVFLVASETNTPALESDTPPNGLFTSSLIEAVEGQLSPEKDEPTRSLQLADAFAFARMKTITKSGDSQTPLIKGFLSSPFAFSPRTIGHLMLEATTINYSALDDIGALRQLDMNQLRFASDLFDTVIALAPQDPEAQQGLARSALYQGNFVIAQDLIDKGIAAILTQPSSNSLSGWLLLRSELKMRHGDIKGAVSDCEQSISIKTDFASAEAFLVGLYFAAGQYEKSSSIATRLLHQHAILTKSDITDDEWGHIVLLRYLAFKRAGNDAEASGALQEYLDVNRGSSLTKDISWPLGKAFGSIAGHKDASEAFVVQAPWVHSVAEVLLDPKADVQHLQQFPQETAAFDEKDPQPFSCIVHFYLGMRSLLNNSPSDGKRELQLAADTGQNQYAEYWSAVAEKSRVHP